MIDLSSKISSDIVALSDLKPSDIHVSAKYHYLDNALIHLMISYQEQYKLTSANKNL